MIIRKQAEKIENLSGKIQMETTPHYKQCPTVIRSEIWHDSAFAVVQNVTTIKEFIVRRLKELAKNL